MTSITAPSRLWQPTAITGGIFLAALFLVAQIPEVCPAIAPAPPSCAPDARESSAWWGAAIILGATVLGIALTYMVPLRVRPAILTGVMIAVALAGVAGIVMAVLASGFILL